MSVGGTGVMVVSTLAAAVVAVVLTLSTRRRLGTVTAVGRWWSGVVLAPPGLALLAAYSVGVELLQLQLARIDRACDVTDMVDNTLGAGVGFVIGVVLLPVVRPWRGRQPAH